MAIDVRDPYVVLEHNVMRRLRDDASHRRVSEALAEVAAAAVYPSRCLIGSRAFSGLLEDPVASATRVAVETLIDELEDLVDTLSTETLNELVGEQRTAELGLE